MWCFQDIVYYASIAPETSKNQNLSSLHWRCIQWDNTEYHT